MSADPYFCQNFASMKLKFIPVVLICALMGTTVFAQNLKVPAPSPSTTIKQDFALSSVELSYSRPAVKGRTIFGDLVPYGKVWRTGANAATTITFGEEVTVGGKKIPAGKYGLLTIPGESEWTIILSKQTNVTSPSAYKESEDVVRFTAKAEQLPFGVETFTIVFGDIKPTSMTTSLLWDRTVVSFDITADIDSKIMSQIDEQMKADKPPYFAAAYYYLENGKDLNKAVQWFDKAIAENPKAFWIYHQKAIAQSKLGKKKDAVATASKSMELAKEASNPDYVALNEKLIASLK
jgi:tetratricopeptide (TPR) repeat protein